MICQFILFVSVLAPLSEGFLSPYRSILIARSTGRPLRPIEPLYSVPAAASASSSSAATTFAGKLWPSLAKLHIGVNEGKQIMSNLISITHPVELIILGAIAFGAKPLADYTLRQELTEANKQRRRFGFAAISSGIAKVALSVYVVDILCVVLSTIGFDFVLQKQLSTSYAKVAYTIWSTQQVLAWKRIVLFKFLNKFREKGRVELLDRLLNGVGIALVSLMLLDWLSLQMSTSLQGLASLASIGTLAFGIASRDVVSQVLGGLFLSTSNKLRRGDRVKFGDGTTGKIRSIGWLETVLEASDNTLTSIPNSKLSGQKVSNLSHVPISQVKQTLRFHYGDADVLPTVMNSIKEEIQASCPELITDGTRPFNVYWTDYNEDHLSVMVLTHHRVPLSSSAYWDVRQDVLLAINRAVKKHNVAFSDLSLSDYKNNLLAPHLVARVSRKANQ
jgi:small-conductance mechanosensitive channel